MTRVKIQVVEDSGNTTDGAVFVRYSTHADGGVYTASTAFGGGGGSLSLSAGTSSAALGSVVFSNSNNVSFGLNGSTVTASATVASTAGSVGVSAGTSSALLGSVEFANSNGVSFGLNGATVTAQHNGLTSQSNQAASAANGSFTFQTLSLANSNGVSFSTGTQGLYASHNGLTSQSNQQVSLYAVGNTTQSTSGTQGAASLSFRGEGVASVGVSNGSVVVSVPAGGGGGALTLYAAGNTSGASSATATANSLVIRGENYATVGVSNGSIRIYQDHQWFSAGTTQWDPYTLYFSNANGVSFGMGSGASASVITASVAAGGGSLNLSAGTTSNNLTAVTFSNANGVSFGLNGSVVTASHNGLTTQSAQAFSAALGGLSTFQTLSFNDGDGMEMSNFGGAIYAHNRFTVSAGTSSAKTHGIQFNNTNNVTFGYSAGTITASVAAPGGGAGITASHWPFVPWPIATSTLPLGTTGGTGGSTQITASFHVCPLVIPAAIAYGAVLMPVSFATVAGTGSVTMGHQIGIYTLNGNTLSQVTSWAWGARLSQNSVTAQSWNWWYGSDSTANTSSLGGNVSATFASLADIVMMDKTTETLNAGQYFLAAIYTRRSSNAAVWGTVHRGQYSVSQFTAAPIFGSNTVRAMIHSLNGLASITTNVAGVTANMLPASFATSIITHTGGTSRNQWPVFKLTPVL